MRYIKKYEVSNTNRKIRVHKLLSSFVDVLGGDITIESGTILRALNRYNKIDRIYLNENSELMLTVSTITKNIHQQTNKAYYYLSFSEMLKVIEYLKDKYPTEYEASKIYDDVKKYNI